MSVPCVLEILRVCGVSWRFVCAGATAWTPPVLAAQVSCLLVLYESCYRTCVCGAPSLATNTGRIREQRRIAVGRGACEDVVTRAVVACVSAVRNSQHPSPVFWGYVARCVCGHCFVASLAIQSSIVVWSLVVPGSTSMWGGMSTWCEVAGADGDR